MGGSVVAVLFLLLLQGCSAIKRGYQQLPTLSYWWLDSTVSFSGAQTPAAKEAIDKLYQWHRREELAGYGELLQRIGQLSAGPLQAEQVCSVATDVQTRLDALMRQAVVHAAPVALALGPRQLSHLARHWESKNEDWEKEWLQGDAQARLDRRVDKAVNRFNSFYGDLNAAQIGMVRAQLAQSPWTAEWGRRDRQRRQQDLLSTLQRLAQSGMTMICVTHEMGFAKKVADTVVFMDGGKIVEQAPPGELFTQPKSDRTKKFLSQILSH